MPDDRHVIEVAARGLAERAVAAARVLTRDGHAIDEHQVVVERVAYAATEARVIAELANAPAQQADAAKVAIAELHASIAMRLAPIAAPLGIEVAHPSVDALAPDKVEAIGAAVIASEGRLAWPLDE